MSYIVIDTETTGLDDDDEVLSIAVVDQDGNKLFYELVRPTHHTEWPGAEIIHGITWNDVEDKNPLTYYEDELRELIDKAPLVVGYNLEYDLEKLASSGILFRPRAEYDLMREYAKVFGEWADWKNDRLWVKLVDVANRYHYSYHAHNALEDAKATAYCYRKFIEECDNLKPEKPARARNIKRAIWQIALALFFLYPSYLFATGQCETHQPEIPSAILFLIFAAIPAYYAVKNIKGR